MPWETDPLYTKLRGSQTQCEPHKEKHSCLCCDSNPGRLAVFTDALQSFSFTFIPRVAVMTSQTEYPFVLRIK